MCNNGVKFDIKSIRLPDFSSSSSTISIISIIT